MGTPLLRVFSPLRQVDFALLWVGMTVSLLGDGVFTLALAWQVYALSDAATALALVGVAWSVPQILIVLVGGAISDRHERRRVMIAADLIRGIAIGVVAVLAFEHVLRLWELAVLSGVFGVGSALFGPAFSAIVPELIPTTLVLHANSLDQLVRPLTTRFLGPALGGWIVASFGFGPAFLADALSFGASIGALLLLRARPRPAPTQRSMLREIGSGFRYVRSQGWLWITIVGSAAAMLFFLGPIYVLVPLLVKNDLHGSAADLGRVLAAGGAGAMLTALLLGSRAVPRRPVAVLCALWAATCFLLVGYAGASRSWQVALVSFVGSGLLVGGQILWSTLLQTEIPAAFLGRVSSFDWLISFTLVPVSYALTGPVAAEIGTRATLAASGVASGTILVALVLLSPQVRSFRAASHGGAADQVPRWGQ